MELKIGEEIGRYKIRELLGNGGFASVYRATDLLSCDDEGVSWALKLLKDKQFTNRMFAEAGHLNELTVQRHPNIVKFVGFHFHRDHVYLITEYVPGITLQQWLESSQKPRATFKAICRIAQQCASALHCAHGQGVSHRDIKPSNLMVESKDPGNLETSSIRLLDFGIALSVDDLGLTATGNRVFSPYYAAPEQFALRSKRNEKRDERKGDIFSLALVLIHVWARQHLIPYANQKDRNEFKYWELLHEAGKDFSKPLGGIFRSEQVATFFAKMLSWNAADRPEATEVEAAFAEFERLQLGPLEFISANLVDPTLELTTGNTLLGDYSDMPPNDVPESISPPPPKSRSNSGVEPPPEGATPAIKEPQPGTQLVSAGGPGAPVKETATRLVKVRRSAYFGASLVALVLVAVWTLMAPTAEAPAPPIPTDGISTSLDSELSTPVVASGGDVSQQPSAPRPTPAIRAVPAVPGKTGRPDVVPEPPGAIRTWAKVPGRSKSDAEKKAPSAKAPEPTIAPVEPVVPRWRKLQKLGNMGTGNKLIGQVVDRSSISGLKPEMGWGCIESEQCNPIWEAKKRETPFLVYLGSDQKSFQKHWSDENKIAEISTTLPIYLFLREGDAEPLEKLADGHKIVLVILDPDQKVRKAQFGNVVDASQDTVVKADLNGVVTGIWQSN